MNYLPVQLPVAKPTNKLTTFAQKGENLLDLSQFTGSDYAQRIENLLPIANARLEKSQGYTEFLTKGTLPITDLVRYNGNTYYGQDTKLYVNDSSIKTMTGTGVFSIVLFGDYIYATNGTEKVGRVSSVLAFDAQTANFVLGEKITGGTSGATGIILEQTDAGVTGTLTLGQVTGTFANDEVITSASGSADVNGVLTFTYTTITNAPICKKLFIYNKRLVCGAISTDKSKVICSEEFVGTFPPFVFPAAASPALVTDQFNYSFSNGGDVNDFAVLGSQLITFYDKGEAGIRADVLDYSGVGVRLNIVTDFQRTGFGGMSAISTKYGVFYSNATGVYQMTSGGSTNQPYSEQQVQISSLFDDRIIENIDFSNSALFLDEKRNLLLISCAESSSFNNLVLVYNIDTKAWTRRTSWYISSFYYDDYIYAGSSFEGKIYKLFDGQQDGANDISITFEQELTQAEVMGLKQLKEVYAGGKLSQGQIVTISFDIYDKAGILVLDYKNITWSPNATSFSHATGIGTAKFGSAIGSGDSSSVSTVNSWLHKMLKIYEYSRIVLRITEESGLPMELSWLSVKTEDKGVNKKYTI